MQGPNLERWQELCRQAATEQDPTKLLELAVEKQLSIAELLSLLPIGLHRCVTSELAY